jgi:hypothetical protein
MVSIPAFRVAKSTVLFLARFARVISEERYICNLIPKCGQEVLSFPVEIDQ